jgi:hypothetical protein
MRRETGWELALLDYVDVSASEFFVRYRYWMTCKLASQVTTIVARFIDIVGC